MFLILRFAQHVVERRREGQHEVEMRQSGAFGTDRRIDEATE